MKMKSKIVLVIGLAIILIFSVMISCGNAFAEDAPANGVNYFDGSENNLTNTYVSEIIDNNLLFDEELSVTFLMHGQGGSDASWSNINGGEELKYDRNSLIEELREKGNADVYVSYVSVVAEGIDDVDNIKYTLQKIEPVEVDGITEYEYSENLRDIVDCNKNIIIVFNQSYKNVYGSHIDSYNEVHFLLDRILYNYFRVNAKVPLVNLIGHSRGGILNLMYATEHIYNIDSIFSLGTPYNGTDIGELCYALYLDHIEDIDDSILATLVKNSTKDIHNETIINELKNNWNEAILLNEEVKAYALGGITSAEFVLELLKVLEKDGDINELIYTLLYDVVEAIAKHPMIFRNTFNLVSLADEIASILGNDAPELIEEIKDSIINVLNNIKPKDYIEIAGIEFCTDLYYFDDILVDYDSQMAAGFDGFQRYCKCYEASDINGEKSISSPPAPHNLESRDKELIRFIIDHIQLEDNVDGYYYYLLNENEVIIDGLKGDCLSLIDEDGKLTIPSTIEGKNVVSISAQAFKNNYAGKQLPCIDTVVIPASVKQIEEGAFSGTTIKQFSVSEGNVDYSAINGHLFNKNGTRIIQYAIGNENQSYTLPDSVLEIGSYAFYQAENLKFVNLNNVKNMGDYAFAESSVENLTGLQIESMGSYAVNDTPWFNNIMAPHTVLGKVYIKYLGTEQIVDLNSFNITEIGCEAFANSGIVKILLPNTINSIGDYAFANCQNIEEFIVGGNVNYIGNGAFSGCENLILDFRRAYPPFVENNAFLYCGDNMEIYVPYLHRNDYENYIAFKLYEEKISTRISLVNFNANIGVECDNLEIPYYSLVENLPILEREGYNFLGWFLGEEQIVNGYLWDRVDNAVLEAEWQIINYAINYHCSADINNNNPYSYTVEDCIMLTAPIKEGYDFIGWYDNEALEGEPIQRINCGTTGNIELFPKLIATQYDIRLEVCSEEALLNETQLVILYDSFITLPIPQRLGYNFLGWFLGENSSDRMIANSVGNMISPWDIDEEVTLYAHWSPYKYTFRLYGVEGETLYIGENGVTTETVALEYDYPIMIYNCINNYFSSIYRMGWIYTHYITNFDDDYEYATSVPYLGADGTVIRIYPQWERENYTIVCYDGGSIVERINVDYNAPFVIDDLSKSGYEFVGWQILFSDSDVAGTELDVGKFFNTKALGMPDLSPKEAANAYMQIGAVWQEEVTNIILDQYGDFNIIRIRKGDMLEDLEEPVRAGYEFLGWFDEFDNRYYNNSIWDGPYGNLSLYSKWEKIEYSITYVSDGGINTNPCKYDVESQIVLSSPERIGYRFNGWKDEDGNIVDVISVGSTGDLVLYADWIGVQYEYDEVDGVINNSVSIINFENVISNDINRTYIVGVQTYEITFIGNLQLFTNVQIIIEPRNSDIILRFCNFNMVAPFGQSAVKAEGNGMVYIESDGNENKVYGGRNNNILFSTYAILAKYITFMGEADLEIVGGDGIEGQPNTDGIIGGVAIKADNIIFLTGNINIRGGNGGRGYDVGESNMDPTDGGDGGNGIVASSVEVIEAILNIQGGVGGVGGIGQNGSAEGENGTDGSDLIIQGLAISFDNFIQGGGDGI